MFEQFNQEALEALKTRDLPRVRAADYFTKDDDAPPEADEQMAQWDEYLSKFVKLTDGKCVCCGISLRCALGMGLFGGFEWGFAHGEGRCVHCHYPMRGHHKVEGLGTVNNLFLAYHPSGLSFAEKEEA
jgi:hypothetical protein